MPGSDESYGSADSSGHDDFEDIEILRNLLEIRTRLRKDKNRIDIELE